MGKCFHKQIQQIHVPKMTPSAGAAAVFLVYSLVSDVWSHPSPGKIFGKPACFPNNDADATAEDIRD